MNDDNNKQPNPSIQPTRQSQSHQIFFFFVEQKFKENEMMMMMMMMIMTTSCIILNCLFEKLNSGKKMTITEEE